MDLEHELRQALKRKEPPPGFGDKVLTRIASGDTTGVATPAGAPLRWIRYVLPLAASLALTAGASYYIQFQQKERDAAIETERAVRNVALALQIAGEKVSAVQTKVQEISQHERQAR